MSDFENYSTIWQCIKLFKPELNCLLSSRFDPAIVVRHYRPPLDFPLEASLHKALGGDKYMKTDLYSKMGVQIGKKNCVGVTLLIVFFCRSCCCV